MMKVEDIMRKPVVVDKDISLSDAARIMSEKKIGSLLYIKEGEVRGIITERDIIKNFQRNKRISQVMSTSLITISPDAEVSDAQKLMQSHSVKRLPVIEDKKLVGIISATDLIAYAEGVDDEFFF